MIDSDLRELERKVATDPSLRPAYWNALIRTGRGTEAADLAAMVLDEDANDPAARDAVARGNPLRRTGYVMRFVNEDMYGDITIIEPGRQWYVLSFPQLFLKKYDPRTVGVKILDMALLDNKLYFLSKQTIYSRYITRGDFRIDHHFRLDYISEDGIMPYLSSAVTSRIIPFHEKNKLVTHEADLNRLLTSAELNSMHNIAPYMHQIVAALPERFVVHDGRQIVTISRNNGQRSTVWHHEVEPAEHVFVQDGTIYVQERRNFGNIPYTRENSRAEVWTMDNLHRELGLPSTPTIARCFNWSPHPTKPEHLGVLYGRAPKLTMATEVPLSVLEHLDKIRRQYPNASRNLELHYPVVHRHPLEEVIIPERWLGRR